jgi:enamine deaminase RidA (YjgF/YER057c/UK114 family)
VTGGTTVYIAGQIALDIGGNLIGAGDLHAQAVQVFKNLQIALESAGATFSDVVKLNMFVVNYSPDDLPALRAVLTEYLPETNRPVSTLVGVTSLARDGLLIEVEVIAVVK